MYVDFPIVEQLDEDPAATTYLVRDAEARDAVAPVATAPVATEDRGAYLRWADRIGTVAGHPHVANLLGTADPVDRDGCDFEGMLTGAMPFEASIEDTGRLTRVAFSAGESGLAGLAAGGERIEATFGNFGTAVDVTSPVTSTPPTEQAGAGLEGRWVGIRGDVQLAIAGGAVGILFQGRELCAGEADTSGIVTVVSLVCPDDTYGNAVATIELTGDGQLLLSGVGIVAGVTLGTYQRAA